MTNKTNKANMCTIIGAILILIGLFMPIPGTALTTYESLNGETTDSYALGNKYSSIDEYVGGDAYNYIIGANLISGKMSGTITAKAIFITSGAICLCSSKIIELLQKYTDNQKTLIELMQNSSIPNNSNPKTEIQDIEENLPKL